MRFLPTILIALVVSIPSASAQPAPDDPSGATRLLWAPTARTLPAGEVHGRAQQIILPSLQAGVTDRITLGAGVVGVPFRFAARPFWVTAKAQVVRTEGMQVAVGHMQVFIPGFEHPGISYVIATRGSSDSAVTFGVGRGYVRPDQGGLTFAMLGGEYRVSARRKLVAESFITRGGGTAGIGVRRIGRRVACDYGLAFVVADGTITQPFPMVNLAWKF